LCAKSHPLRSRAAQHRRAAVRARQLHRRPHPLLAVGGQMAQSAIPTSRRPRAPEGDWSDTCEGACRRLRRAGCASGGAAPRSGWVQGGSILPIYGTNRLEKGPPNPRDQSLRRGGSSSKTLISPRGPSPTTRPVSYRRHSSPREEEVGEGGGGGGPASTRAATRAAPARLHASRGARAPARRRTAARAPGRDTRRVRLVRGEGRGVST
jgi:hypothetical protein